MEYTTKDGDTVEARDLTLKVELGEKTMNEIVSRAMSRMHEATDTIERLMQALAEADAENKELKALVRDMWQTISKDDECRWDIDANCCTSDECNVSCRYWFRIKELGIEVEQ